MSWDEAIARGLVSAADRPEQGDGHQARVAVPRKTQTPQEMLWYAIDEKWPGRASWELSGVVPGRRYRIDIAFEAEKVAVEVDGLKDHTSLKGFRRDREKDVLLARMGWRVLRFIPGQIYNGMPWVIESIEEVLDLPSS